MSARSTALPVRVQGGEKSFGRRRLWSDVDFEADGGQMVALAGPSGSGKTTLLNCIGMLESFDAGTLTYGDRVMSSARGVRRRLYRDAVGFLFQNCGLVDNWTVRENLQIALSHRRLARPERQHRIADALERMGLEGFGNDVVHTLSGGEQQRVGLARLLLKEPSVVLADEPTASLDRTNSDVVIDTLRRLAEQGAAVIVSTHDERVVGASDAVVRLVGHARNVGSLAHREPRGEQTRVEASSDAD